MKKSLLILATFVVTVVSGCGGTELEHDEGLLGQSESALSTCSTTCPNGTPLTCQGTSCSATDGQSVTCDGVTQTCGLIIEPVPTCSLSNSCTNLDGTTCSTIGSTRTCCVGRAVAGNCACLSNRKWSCHSLVDPGLFEPSPTNPGTKSP